MIGKPCVSVKLKMMSHFKNELKVCGVTDQVIDIFLKMRLHYYAKFLSKELRSKHKIENVIYSFPKKNKKMLIFSILPLCHVILAELLVCKFQETLLF